MTQINLYPNPVLDEVNIYFDSREGGSYEIEIYNQLGLSVDKVFVFAVEGGNDARINVITYDAGYYVAKIIGPNNDVKQFKFYKRN